jgi:hypothetical protein
MCVAFGFRRVVGVAPSFRRVACVACASDHELLIESVSIASECVQSSIARSLLLPARVSRVAWSREELLRASSLACNEALRRSVLSLSSLKVACAKRRLWLVRTEGEGNFLSF